jgi:tetratricopeptide (TPR) repeat protein
MKKQLILLSIGTFLSVSVIAQKTEMTTAIMSYDSYQKALMRQDMANAKPLIVKAKEKIEEAHVKQQSTNMLKQKDIAKLHYNRFMIYLNYASLAAFDESIAKEVEANSDAYEAAIKSSYDILSKNDPKKEYLEQLYAFIGAQRAQAVNMGITLFQKEDFENAFMMFQGAAQMYEMINQHDSLSYYNAGLSAFRIAKYDDAVEYFQKAANVGYEGALSHVQIINSLRAGGADDEKVLNAIVAARKAYPADYGLLIEELNYYLSNDKAQEASELLRIAIEKNPNDHVLHYTIGNVYDKQGNFEKAEESYLKAIQIKEDYIDAQYSIGALYINNSSELKKQASSEKDRAKYQQANEVANDMLKKAIAPLERAYAIDPEGVDAKNILSALKSIYFQFEMMEDYNRIKALLEK